MKRGEITEKKHHLYIQVQLKNVRKIIMIKTFFTQFSSKGMRNHATHRSKLDKMITIQKIQFTGKTGQITDKTPPVKCKCVN